MRRELEERPFLLAFVAMSVGISGAISGWNLLFGLPILVLLKESSARIVLVVACILGYLVTPNLSANIVRKQEYLIGQFDVVSMPRPGNSGDICQIRDGDRKLSMVFRGDFEVSLGDRIAAEGVLRSNSEGAERSALVQGVVGVLLVHKQPLIIRHGSPIWATGLAMRRSFVNYVSRSYEPRVASTIDGMCFNVDARMDDELMTHLRRSGTIHIISASGLHVFILAAALIFLLERLPLPRWTMLALLLLILTAYAAAAGLRPPIVRSCLMFMIPLGAYLFRREGDALSALSVAGVLYLIFDARQLLDVGFQLSFVTVAAFVMYLQGVRIRQSSAQEFVRDSFVELLKASAVATIASAPLVAYHFGMVSLVSIPANLMITPVVAPLMIGALAAWGLSGILPAVGSVFEVLVARPLTGYVIGVADFWGGPSWSTIEIPPFSAYWLVVIYALLLFVWRPYEKPA